MTKQELLRKGVSEQVADEIVSYLSEPDSLRILEKALNKADEPEEESEEEEPEEEEEDEYNEEYMKKYMKKYMSENKKACGKMAKELGIVNDDMKKAIDDFNFSGDGAVIEMEELSPILYAQQEFNAALTKAIRNISNKVEEIHLQNQTGFDLLQKAARLQVEQAKALDAELSKPQGRKSVNVSMEKAGSPDESAFLYATLLKAVQNGDTNAGQIISVYESAGKNLNALSTEQKQYILTLGGK